MPKLNSDIPKKESYRFDDELKPESSYDFIDLEHEEREEEHTAYCTLLKKLYNLLKVL